MSKRSERREAEREARKSAYIALRQQRAQSAAVLDQTAVAPEPESFLPTTDAPTPALEVPPVANEPSPISEAQLTANRANSQRSTGPITDEGKAISSKNALIHGLTSKTTVLPTEDPALYQRELDSFREAYQPVTREELLQVETVVDSLWRLARLRRIETGILRKGCFEFQNNTKTNSNPEVEAYLKYEKSIRNLHIQEARLQRQIQKAQAELGRLQTIRRREEAAAAKAANQPQTNAATALNGFDFSTSGIRHKPTARKTGNPPPSHR